MISISNRLYVGDTCFEIGWFVASQVGEDRAGWASSFGVVHYLYKTHS